MKVPCCWNERYPKKEAIKFLKTILGDPLIEIIHADEEVELEGFSLYRKYLDQSYSIVDCISFVVMKRFGISRCFTFDQHFTAMGFDVEPI